MVSVSDVAPVINVKGREIALTKNELVEIYQQAWRRHRARPGYRQLVALRADLMARILGRKVRHDSKHVYTADADTDEIACGQQQVWKTGGRQVIEWVLAHTSEEDLALCDYVDRLMWLSHCCNLAAAGNPICPEHAPTALRNGKQVPEDEYWAMLRRLDESRGNGLVRLERQLASLLAEQDTEGGR